jgi:molecular chaperone DnaJ
MFRVVRTCHVCGGRGQVIKSPCTTCRGQGQVQKDKTLSVKVPAGIEDGMRIRLSGEGDSGARGGPPGDLYLFVSVRQHSLFERDGSELFCRATVPMTTAALGGDVEIPGLDGQRTKVAIPAGTQTGRRFRLKGQGMPSMRNAQKGDLHIEVFVETPTNLTAKQRKLLEEFSASCGAESHPQSTGFFDSVKRFIDGHPAKR